MSNFNKLAYGAYFDEGEYDRWLDGGQAYGFNKNDAVRLTKLFADEAAKRKAKLMFHSKKYDSDVFSPEEAIKRLQAVTDKDLLSSSYDAIDKLPNYYDLTYPRKPRSGLLEYLRLRTPGVIESWGPEGHPMGAVNKEVERLSKKTAGTLDLRFNKAAAFGARMGRLSFIKMAADPNTGGAPSPKMPAPQLPQNTDFQGMYSNYLKANPNQPQSFPGNAGPSMGAPNSNQPVNPQSSSPPPRRYANNEEMIRRAQQMDAANKKLTGQRVAQMSPSQRREYDARSGNESMAQAQLSGAIPPSMGGFKPQGRPMSPKEQEMYNMKHYQEQANVNKANLTPGSLAAERSKQHDKAQGDAMSVAAQAASIPMMGAAVHKGSHLLTKGFGKAFEKLSPYMTPAVSDAVGYLGSKYGPTAAHVAAHGIYEGTGAPAFPLPTNLGSVVPWAAGTVAHEGAHQLGHLPSHAGHLLESVVEAGRNKFNPEAGRGHMADSPHKPPMYSGGQSNPQPLSGNFNNTPQG